MFGYIGDVVFCFDGSDFLNKKIVNMYNECDLCVFHGSQVFGYLRILDVFLSHLSFAPWKFEPLQPGRSSPMPAAKYSWQIIPKASSSLRAGFYMLGCRNVHSSQIQ